MKPSVAEYKSYIRELKLRMKQLVVKNKELTKLVAKSRVANFMNNNKPKASLEDLLRTQKNVILIQKNIRGFLHRRRLKKKLTATAISSKIPVEIERADQSLRCKQEVPSEMRTNIKAMENFERVLSRRNMTPEMIFRMANETGDGKVDTRRFTLFVNSLGLGLKSGDVGRLAHIVDEECLGVISQKDYLLTLSAYGVAKEESTHEKIFGGLYGGRTLGQILLIKLGALLMNNQTSVKEFVSGTFKQQNSRTTRKLEGIKIKSFLSAINTESREAGVIFSLKEKHALVRYLNIDNDGLLKPDFMNRELNKVLSILEKGQIPTENLLTSEQNHYNNHFEILRGSQKDLDRNQPNFCAGLLKDLRENKIKTNIFFDTLGVFLLQNFEQTSLGTDSHSVMISPSTFSEFLESVWGHKISDRRIKKISSSLSEFKAASMNNLDDGIFRGNDEACINISELVSRLGMTIRFKQKAQLTGFKKAIFLLILRHKNLRVKRYFQNQKIKNLEKRIQLSEFHFILSRHLGFGLEDTDLEFRSLDPRQYGKVSLSAFIKKLEEMEQSKSLGNGSVVTENRDTQRDSMMSVSQKSVASSSRRRKKKESSRYAQSGSKKKDSQIKIKRKPLSNVNSSNRLISEMRTDRNKNSKKTNKYKENRENTYKNRKKKKQQKPKVDPEQKYQYKKMKSKIDLEERDSEFVYTLAEYLVSNQTDFSSGIEKQDMQIAISHVMQLLSMHRANPKTITSRWYPREKKLLGFLELLEKVGSSIANEKERCEFHFFVLAKVLDKRKKNTLQLLSGYGLIRSVSAVELREATSEHEIEDISLDREEFVRSASGLLGLSRLKTEAVFEYISNGDSSINGKRVVELIDQFRTSYYFQKYLEVPREYDAKEKARSLMEILISDEVGSFLSLLEDANLAVEDCVGFESDFDSNGKVCLLKMRENFCNEIQDCGNHRTSCPEKGIIGRFLKKCDLDSNGSIEAKEFLVILNIKRLREELEGKEIYRAERKRRLEEKLEKYLLEESGSKSAILESERRIFNKIFGQERKSKVKSKLENQTSFGEEFKSIFGKKDEPVRETVNEIRQLIDDQIFSDKNNRSGYSNKTSKKSSTQDQKNPKNQRKYGEIEISNKIDSRTAQEAKNVLESSIQVLKERDMTPQDLLDDLSFNSSLEIPIIHVRQHLKQLCPDPDDYRRISSCLKYLDRNKNGSAHYLEIFDFFNGSISTPKANRLEHVWVKNGLKRGLGGDVAKFIKNKNTQQLKGGLTEGLNLLFNKKAKKRLNQMSESEILRAVNEVLDRNDLKFEDVIDDLDFDENFDVAMIDLKNVFREKLEKKEDLRIIVRALRSMDTNKNGNINFAEFVDFTKRLDEVGDTQNNNAEGGFAEEDEVDATESFRPIGRMIHDLGRSNANNEYSRYGDQRNSRNNSRGRRDRSRRNEGRMDRAGYSDRASGISQKFAHNRKFLESQMIKNLNKRRHEHSRSQITGQHTDRSNRHHNTSNFAERNQNYHRGNFMRQMSSIAEKQQKSISNLVPELKRSSSLIVNQNSNCALHRLTKLNGKELMSLKEASDEIFQSFNEISFLGLRGIFTRAGIKLSMPEALAIFKIIDANQSHRICKSELENFMLKLLIKALDEARNPRTEHKNSVKRELAESLFRAPGDGSGRVKNAMKSNIRHGMHSKIKKMLRRESTLSDVSAAKKLEEISSLNLKTADMLESLSSMDDSRYKNFKYVFNCPFAALKECLRIVQVLQNQQSPNFEDDEFGPNDSDKYGAHSIYHGETLPGYPHPEDMTWLRPAQILGSEENVNFMEDGTHSNDVIQGGIGDCWFIGAMSVVATKSTLISHELKRQDLGSKSRGLSDQSVHEILSGVYPALFHYFSRFGMFVLRFFKDYQWRYVLIDDRLPCFGDEGQDPVLIFARCESQNEFWVPLVEKAYAKLHGTYAALISGVTDDGLVDMSGFVSEKVKVLDKRGRFNAKDLKSPDQLWKKIQRDLGAGSMMGCSIVGASIEGEVYLEGEPTGLYSGHAYSVLDAFELSNGTRLLKIRNPWGSGNPKEWNGAWSDNSQELIENLDQINSLLKKKWGRDYEPLAAENKDGSFLMNYNDFYSMWHNLSICKKFEDSWSGLRIEGSFGSNNSGGTPYRNDPQMFEAYLKNPQFILNLSKDTTIFLSLGQEDGRVKSRGEDPFPFSKHIHPLSLTVFKLDRSERNLKRFDQSKMKTRPFIKNYRDVQVEARLEAGKYVIVPSTKLQGSEGRFFLNIYFDCSKRDLSIDHSKKKFKAETIVEEEEGTVQAPSEVKRLIKDFLTEFAIKN